MFNLLHIHYLMLLTSWMAKYVMIHTTPFYFYWFFCLIAIESCNLMMLALKKKYLFNIIFTPCSPFIHSNVFWDCVCVCVYFILSQFNMFVLPQIKDFFHFFVPRINFLFQCWLFTQSQSQSQTEHKTFNCNTIL